MSSKKKGVKIDQTFFAGLVLFFLGIAGIILWFYSRAVTPLDTFFSADTVIFSEIKLTKNSAKELGTVFPEVDFPVLMNSIFGDFFEFDFRSEVLPWIGGRIGMSVFENGDIVVATSYTSRKKAEEFLNRFRLPDEEFDIQELDDGEVWMPAYSSQIAVGFSHGYVLFGSSADALRRTLNDVQKLASVEMYKKIRSDLPRGTLGFLFADTEKSQSVLLKSPQFASQKPIFKTIGQTLPAIGITVEQDAEGLTLQSKILTEKGVFQERKIPKTNQILPELAQFAPQNVLFFMNGTDLYGKYQHTKDFLTDFNPQFSVIFDGILRGVSKQIFGAEFDFEQDFLAKMHGQYALILDFQDPLSPFVYLTLITGFGGGDIEQNLSDFHSAVQFSQGKFSTELKTVSLPDGTTREEMISVEAPNISIEKGDLDGQNYFTFQGQAGSEKKFSYAFTGGYFVFSTSEDGVRSVLASGQNPNGSLAENADFRESVLFRFSPSESYGFFSMTKLASVLELLSQQNTESLPVFSYFLRSGIRNIVFARKVFPQEIFWTATLFAR